MSTSLFDVIYNTRHTGRRIALNLVVEEVNVVIVVVDDERTLSGTEDGVFLVDDTTRSVILSTFFEEGACFPVEDVSELFGLSVVNENVLRIFVTLSSLSVDRSDDGIDGCLFGVRVIIDGGFDGSLPLSGYDLPQRYRRESSNGRIGRETGNDLCQLALRDLWVSSFYVKNSELSVTKIWESSRGDLSNGTIELVGHVGECVVRVTRFESALLVDDTTVSCRDGYIRTEDVDEVRSEYSSIGGIVRGRKGIEDCHEVRVGGHGRHGGSELVVKFLNDGHIDVVVSKKRGELVYESVFQNEQTAIVISLRRVDLVEISYDVVESEGLIGLSVNSSGYGRGEDGESNFASDAIVTGTRDDFGVSYSTVVVGIGYFGIGALQHAVKTVEGT